MSLDIDEVESVENYNDFLEPPYPSTPKLLGDGLPTTTTSLNSPQEQYQVCENCGRKFFMGRLACHLKICTKIKPMIRSPAKSEKNGFRQQQACLASQVPQIKDKPVTDSLRTRPGKYWCCPSCKLSVPLSIVSYHREHCLAHQFHSAQITPRATITPQARRSVLPKITKQRDPIKIRQQLSCFSRAANIQQVECHFCNRKFEKSAALRHIPVCEKVMDTRDLKVRKKLQLQINLKTKGTFEGSEQCTNCHKEVQVSHKFCGYCGAKRTINKEGQENFNKQAVQHNEYNS